MSSETEIKNKQEIEYLYTKSFGKQKKSWVKFGFLNQTLECLLIETNTSGKVNRTTLKNVTIKRHTGTGLEIERLDSEEVIITVLKSKSSISSVDKIQSIIVFNQLQ